MRGMRLWEEKAEEEVVNMGKLACQKYPRNIDELSFLVRVHMKYF